MPLIKRSAAATLPTDAQGESAIVQEPAKVEAPPKAEAPKPVYTGRKAASDTMSKDEWAAKDRRIGRAGLYQAALQSVGVNQYATGRTLAEYLAVVRQAAEDGLAFVNQAPE